MADVTVVPQEWTMVHFDSARIEAVAATLVDQIGIAAPVTIEVDETTPMGRVWVESLDPVVVKVQSGGFEDPKRPRYLSEEAVADVLGRLLHRVRDRLDDAFGDPPPDDDLTLAQSTAWDTYAVGRFARLGYPANRQRRLYHFRNRHGFSDIADAVFDRLWEAEGLTWADLLAACDETEETRTPVG
ncbi:MAG TPA: hypothetical protein VMN58_12960 [Acidimicrobiales bacterium]|nr:hypothetical protein [Acidimicrobiales bacterium]